MAPKKQTPQESLRALTRPGRKQTQRFSQSLAYCAGDMPPEAMVAFVEAITMGRSPIMVPDDSELGWHIDDAPDGAELPTLAERASALKLLKEWRYGLTPQKIELTPPDLNLDLEQITNQGMAKAMLILDLLRAPQIELTAGVPRPDSSLPADEIRTTETPPGTFHPEIRLQIASETAPISPENAPETAPEASASHHEADPELELAPPAKV